MDRIEPAAMISLLALQPVQRWAQPEESLLTPKASQELSHQRSPQSPKDQMGGASIGA
jgi:hypothetical protein